MQNGFGRNRSRERGFTMAEVLVSIVILLSGLVMVAQVVPTAIGLNASNRRDSMALVIGQRVLDQMVSQPLTLAGFTDTLGCIWTLGNPATPGALAGSPVIVANNRTVIDFTAAPVAGYSCTYRDPNDASQVTYDIRLAVIVYGVGGNANGKRFILGAVERGGNRPFQAVTLDTILER